MYHKCFIVFFSRLDAKVYYHAEDDFLAFNGRMGHKILLGQKVQAQIKIQDTMLLPRKIKKHGDVGVL